MRGISNCQRPNSIHSFRHFFPFVRILLVWQRLWCACVCAFVGKIFFGFVKNTLKTIQERETHMHRRQSTMLIGGKVKEEKKIIFDNNKRRKKGESTIMKCATCSLCTQTIRTTPVC